MDDRLLSEALCMARRTERLFPIDVPGNGWRRFHASGFARPVCGVVYRTGDVVTNGMPLGGVDTGCLDLETTGLLGYCTIFNTHVPRRGPINLPLLGLSVSGRTWVLCVPRPKDGEGGWQPSAKGRPYQISRDGVEVKQNQLITPVPTQLDLRGVGTAREIHYWGHYPVADLEFQTDAPIQIGLRAWSPFLPGDETSSMLPAIALDVHLRNRSRSPKAGTIAASFPGPTKEEAGCDVLARKKVRGNLQGVEVIGSRTSYLLAAAGARRTRTGSELGGSGELWSAMAGRLPEPGPGDSGSSIAADFRLRANQSSTVHFIIAWHAPEWNAGGYNWAGAEHDFAHMYASCYPSARRAAQQLWRKHDRLLERVLAWQQVIYDEEDIPVWLRDSLVNVLHLITEDGLWAQAKPPVPDWARTGDGLFGMIECPRGCPQIECIPCSFYGNQPLVYFFPRLAISTLRGYKGYQYPDGAPPWIFGGCTGRTPPIDFSNPTKGYQFATNGISLAAMVDRYRLCHRDEEFDMEFYPVLKRSVIWTLGLRTTPSYSAGDRIIAMPDPDSDESAKPPTEWFEAREPGWFGMTAHVGLLHLAELLIAERMAKASGDLAFARECGEWIKAARVSMEKLWTGSYYMNFLEPDTGKRSDLVFGYQLDGEWIARHHGLPSTMPLDRIETTLATIRRCNIALSNHGAVNYANPDGTPAKVAGYGTFSYFPPEALMLAMTYIYHGQRDLGVDLAHKVWHNIVCTHGYTWDMPNIMRGDVDTGERTFGNDYYQDMMLWSLPAALKGQDFGGPANPGGLVARILRAASHGRTRCR